MGVFLWPLVSSHSVGSWLKPVLQKLDFGVGEFLQKVKENHGNGGPPQPCASTRTVLMAVVCLSERRLSQARKEQENLDSDLSSMFPKVSKGRRQQTGGTCLPLVAVGGFLSFQTLVFSVSVLQLDSAVCQDMSVSDTDASTWTDTGTFNLSEGHTPQTENSEGAFDDQRGV